MEIKKVVDKINGVLTSYEILDEETVCSIYETISKKLLPIGISVRFYGTENIDKIRELKSTNDQFIPGFKIILTTMGKTKYFNKPLVRRCCGTVLYIGEYEDGLKCNALVITPNVFNTNISAAGLEKVKKHINADNYTAHPIKDGSVVSIYYDQNLIYTDEKQRFCIGRWLMSSKKHAECDGVNWRGIEFGNIMDDVLKQYDGFELEKLDKKVSYNIGFQHNSYHVFSCEKPCAWIISGFNTTDFTKISEAELIATGLPLQPVISIDNNIFEKCQSSYTDYIGNQDKSEKFLGCFLRSKDETITGEYSDILIESSLWCEVRLCVYKQPFISDKIERRKYMEKFRDMNKTIVSCYLDKFKHPKFILLFPQYKPIYDAMDLIIKSVVESIMDIANKRQTKTTVKGKNIVNIVKYFRTEIEQRYDLNPSADELFIKNYITHPNHIESYMSCIKHISPEVLVGVKKI